MSNFADKIKMTLYALPETLQKAEELCRQDGCLSKSEFIEKAINFYCGYLTADDCREYYPSVIVNTVKGTLDSMENRMASLIFKLAVELSMNLHVTASLADVEESALTRLRGECVNEVKRLNGKITFEEAYQRHKE